MPSSATRPRCRSDPRRAAIHRCAQNDRARAPVRPAPARASRARDGCRSAPARWRRRGCSPGWRRACGRSLRARPRDCNARRRSAARRRSPRRNDRSRRACLPCAAARTPRLWVMAPWPGVMRSAARYDRSASSSRPDLCRAIASATSFWNSLAASASMVQYRVLRDVDGKPPPARRGHARCQLYCTGTHAKTACHDLDIWLAPRQRTSAPTRRPPSQVGEQTSPCTTSVSRLALARLR